MAQKNDTPALIVALLITVGLIGGGLWWLRQQPGGIAGLINGGNNSASPTPTDSPTPAPTAVTPTASGNNFSSVANVPSGLFNYGGSTSWAPIRSTIDPQMTAAFSNFQLRYTDPVSGQAGSATGIRMLLDNQLAFAQSSRSFSAQENQEAQQRGFALKAIPVAIEGIAIAVHPDLNLPGLTIEQLRGIYTGTITNWSQVGGPNLPITAFSRRVEDSGTVEFFVENVLGGTSLGASVRSIGTTTEALRAVASDRGGIYFASAPEVVGQCTVKPLAIGRQAGQFVAPYQGEIFLSPQCPGQRTQLNIDALRNNYPLTRQLFVIVKQNGQADQQAGEAYANLLLTSQGQDLLRQAGFVPIR
ncbi:MAG: PstS family phosphate ABC transporter substrate-binding protein [Microcoleus sp. SIO2G3]|nr:PstS family phosphate ABC transporter substrate-binding protein [Microcoleus sp. SIO2G3]